MTSSEFSAGPQAAGYLYQARHALLLLLRGGEDAELKIEGLDDIDLTHPTTNSQLHAQLKHQVNRAANLTDASPDIWKTIRVWATHLVRGALPPHVDLSLVTTATAPDESAMSYLRDDGKRSVDDALRLLRAVPSSSTNRSLAPAFAAFNGLSDPQQRLLVDRITLFDGSANLVEIGDDIRSEIRYATHPALVNAVQERLEGWWFAQVAQHLVERPDVPIARVEVHLKLSSIAEQFHSDDLPIDFASSIPDAIDAMGDQRQFVSQVREVTSSTRRIERCIIDYYRAYEQRSRWLREELLLATDLTEYEGRLVDEWERYRLALEDDGAPDEEDSAACVVFGRKLLTWMETAAEIPIRARVTEGYVMRGSFHMLADQPRPRVWWHPLFLQKLQQLTTNSAD
jgi:hypothetical protein